MVDALVLAKGKLRIKSTEIEKKMFRPLIMVATDLPQVFNI